MHLMSDRGRLARQPHTTSTIRIAAKPLKARITSAPKTRSPRCQFCVLQRGLLLNNSPRASLSDRAHSRRHAASSIRLTGAALLKTIARLHRPRRARRPRSQFRVLGQTEGMTKVLTSAFEELHLSFVLLGLFSRVEGAEIFALTSLWIYFPRIQPIFAGL
jgi:hypothetical protein